MNQPSAPAQRRIGALIFPILVLVAFGAGVAAAMGAQPPGVWVFVLVMAGWIISLCLHEFAHAATALAGGDTSVRARGYLTLNPLRYTDPVFSLLIPAILLAVGGIPLPGGAVLIEPHRLRRPGWASLVSVAGPGTNLVCGIVLTLACAAIAPVSALGAGLAFLAVLQFAAAVLNALPVPGLDGFGIIGPFLPASAHRFIAPIRPWAGLVLFALLWSIPEAFSWLFAAARGMFEVFGGSPGSAALGQYLFQFWKY